MPHKKIEPLKEQFRKRLVEQLTPGKSKHEDKHTGEDSKHIYSYNTFHSYKKRCYAFADWCMKKEKIAKELGHKPRTPEECRAYAGQWIESLIAAEHSPSTIKQYVSALAKFYQCNGEDFGAKTPPRRRAGITRSRNEVESDKYFNTSLPQNADLITVVSCIGSRRRELGLLRGTDLVIEDGKAYISFERGTKGGRERVSEIVGTVEEIRLVIDKFKAAGDGKVFKTVNTHADIHSFRARYAGKVYQKYARSFDEYKNERLIIKNNRIVARYKTKNGRRNVSDFIYLYKSNGKMLEGYRDVPSAYYCRRDMKGEVYDRVAMFKASEALGHNRECVVAENYFWNM